MLRESTNVSNANLRFRFILKMKGNEMIYKRSHPNMEYKNQNIFYLHVCIFIYTQWTTQEAKCKTKPSQKSVLS